MLSKNTITDACDPNGVVAVSGANSTRMNDQNPFQSDLNFLNTLGGTQPFSGNASLRFEGTNFKLILFPGFWMLAYAK